MTALPAYSKTIRAQCYYTRCCPGFNDSSAQRYVFQSQKKYKRQKGRRKEERKKEKKKKKRKEKKLRKPCDRLDGLAAQWN